MTKLRDFMLSQSVNSMRSSSSITKSNIASRNQLVSSSTEARYITQPANDQKKSLSHNEALRVDYLKKRFKAVNEATKMPKKSLKSVVNSVNFMSSQLLKEIRAHDDPKSSDVKMDRFYQAICAVTQPTLTKSADIQSPASAAIKEFKRIKSVKNVTASLRSNKMLMVPETQLEAMPGTLDSQLVNFEIYNRSTRPKLNHT